MRLNISHKFLGNCISFYVNSLLMSFIYVLFSYIWVRVPYRVNYFHCCIYLSILFGFRHEDFIFSCSQTQVFPFVISFIPSQKFSSFLGDKVI